MSLQKIKDDLAKDLFGQVAKEAQEKKSAPNVKSRLYQNAILMQDGGNIKLVVYVKSVLMLYGWITCKLGELNDIIYSSQTSRK